MIDDVTNEAIDKIKTKIGLEVKNLENNIDEMNDIIHRTVLFSGNFGPLGEIKTTDDPTSTWFGSMLDAREESDKYNRYVKRDIRENYDKTLTHSNPTRKLQESCMVVFESDVSRAVYNELRNITGEK